MPNLLASLALLMIAGVGDAAADGGVELAQLSIQQRVVIRVPRMPAPQSKAPPPPTAFVERKGPKCVPVQTLAGAAITRSDSVDLVLSGGQMLRAHLEDDCPALDFYSGFYLKPARDGKVCADRDSVRSRSGGQCRIDKFTTLKRKSRNN